MNETMDYSEEFALDEFLEIIMKYNLNIYIHEWKKDFLTKFTSLGGFFGYELIDSYYKRLKDHHNKSKKLIEEFYYTCLPIMHFHSGVQEYASKHLEFKFPMRSSCQVEEFMLFLEDPTPSDNNEKLLISGLQLPDSALHHLAPRLIKVIMEYKYNIFDLSILIKRLILWGNNIMAKLIKKGNCSTLFQRKILHY